MAKRAMSTEQLVIRAKDIAAQIKFGGTTTPLSLARVSCAPTELGATSEMAETVRALIDYIALLQARIERLEA